MRRVLTSLLAALVLAGCGQASETATEASTPESTATTVTEPTTVASTLPAQTEDPERETHRSITVGGIGSEYAVPTRTIVNLAVNSRGDTVQEASQAASAAGEAMLAALTSAGVASDDMQTSEFSIDPYYDQYSEPYPAIAGYEVRIGYRVTIQDVDDIGSILAAAVRAGGDDVRAWGMRFEADPDGLMEVARTEAWEDVEARAAALAALSGEPLGEVLDIHEKVLLSSSSGMVQGGEGDSASFDIPAAPGVAGVIVLLTVTYALGS